MSILGETRFYRRSCGVQKWNLHRLQQGQIDLGITTPTQFKGVQRFTGHIGYYQRFIYIYTKLARSLHRLLINFVWTDECEKAYDALKRGLASAPILCAPNWDLIFHVQFDASNFAIGCVCWDIELHSWYVRVTIVHLCHRLVSYRCIGTLPMNNS